jgi:hypothetical protein
MDERKSHQHWALLCGLRRLYNIRRRAASQRCAPHFQKYLFEEFEKPIRRHVGFGGQTPLQTCPDKMIAHIDKKRKALGIDRSRERTLVDMAARRDLEAV